MAVHKVRFKWSKRYTLLAAVALLVVGVVTVLAVSESRTKKPANITTTNTGSSSSAPITFNLPVTPPPKPQAQIVADYKASAQQITLADLQKDPNSYSSKIITFTATITKFLQDSSGNTGAMNVNDPNDFSSAYVNLSTYIDLTKVNQNDTVQIWGSGLGVISGKNAFGGDINVAGVNESYLLDTTTGYSDDANPAP
jgi:hypothetical protein